MRFFVSSVLLFSWIANGFANRLIHCPSSTVPVTGFAQSFLFDNKISRAKIAVLETGKIIYSDKKGNFQFCAKPGAQITLLLKKKSFLPWNDYKTTQSATFVVPKNGFVGRFNNITFQVPTMATYRLLKTIISEERGIQLDPTKCNIVTTVTAFHKTLYDDPQGEPNATVFLQQSHKPIMLPTQPFYFGIIAGKTNPFTPKRVTTSLDGGVLIYNLAASNVPYLIFARKKGVQFNAKQFICKPGAFINISPPQGPTVQQPYSPMG